MSVSLQRNPGSTQVRNAGASKNNIAALYFQVIQGAVPIVGFGHFTSATRFNSLSYWDPSLIGGANYDGVDFTDMWPNVYQTLTEVISGGGATGTRVTTTSFNMDQMFVQTLTDPSGLFGVNGFLGPSTGGSVTGLGTGFTQTWSDGTTTWTYTASVTDQLDAYAHWVDWTAQALAMVGDFDFPAWDDSTWYGTYGGLIPVPGSSNYWLIAPINASPGYEVNITNVPPPSNFNTSWFQTLVLCAASYGMAVRCASANTPPNAGNAGSLGNPDTPIALAYVQDEPSPSSISGTTVNWNTGWVVCTKSRWRLLGLPSAFPVIPDNNTAHMDGFWAQQLSVDVHGTPSYGTTYTLARGSGFGEYTIAALDVWAALGTYAYGMIGLRHP